MRTALGGSGLSFLDFGATSARATSPYVSVLVPSPRPSLKITIWSICVNFPFLKFCSTGSSGGPPRFVSVR